MKNKKLKITINKVYTKNGDKGNTFLVGGHIVPKNSIRVECYGSVDELNANLANCITLIYNNLKNRKKFIELAKLLEIYQHELFNLGNMIATLPEDYNKEMPQINSDIIIQMENKIDFYNKDLPSLNSFVLPGGHELSVRFHICRTICRRSERLVVSLSQSEEIDMKIVSFLNRFSDFLFVASRWINSQLNINEVTWNPKYNE